VDQFRAVTNTGRHVAEQYFMLYVLVVHDCPRRFLDLLMIRLIVGTYRLGQVGI